MNKYIVDVYYNKNMLSLLNGYSDSDELECVLTGIVVDAMSINNACEYIFTELQDPRHMRSMSMGDVLFIREYAADGMTNWHWYACAAVGFVVIDNHV